MGFPVFHVGFHPADSLGRLDVVAHNVPISCADVLVYPGDLILADHDGVVVVPHAAAEEALRLAEEKVSGENLVREGARRRDEHRRGVQEVRHPVGGGRVLTG
jgi:regulator of RNase E activity RraA